MQARMTNPVTIFPDARKALLQLVDTTHATDLSTEVLELVHLRASQINGCGFCVEYGAQSARKAGASDDRLIAVSAWRDSPRFTDAERAALALAECMTRLSDRPDPVPDEVYDAAAQHFDEQQLSALILWITTTNAFNRINVTTRQVAGTWT